MNTENKMSNSIEIVLANLSIYGKRVFDIRNVIANLQFLLRLNGETDEDIIAGIRHEYDPTTQKYTLYGSSTEPWKTTVRDLENKRLFNAMIQLRILTLNPLSIYQAVLVERAKKMVAEGIGRNIKMANLEGFSETAGSILYARNPDANPIIYDIGDSNIEGKDETITYTSDDLPDGAVMNINTNIFYGFPIRGIYSIMNRMHSLESAGLYAIASMESYKQICKQWGILIVDDITVEEMANLPMIFETSTISPFLIVKRHLNLFHDAPWSAATASRVRGLNLGLPWAATSFDGQTSERPFADDGFVDFFFGDGNESETKPMLFMMPTSRSLANIVRKIQPMWDTFYKDKPLIVGKMENNIYSVEIGDIVQWIRFRAMLRRVLSQ